MPDIEASLSFLADIPLYGHEKPFRVVLSADEPDVEESLKSNVEMEIHDKIELRNIRGMDMLPSLDIQGFEFIRHKTKYKRLDEVWQCKGYTKEITAVLENHLGAERVITWDLRKRHAITYKKGEEYDANDPRQPDGPAVMAHCDYSFDGGLRMIEAYMPAADKLKYLNDKYRVRLINTWRPMVPIIQDHPLAVCDVRSVDPEKLLPCDRVLGGRLGENYLLQYHKGQKWHWLDGQTPDEPLLFLSWDSEAGEGTRSCAHVSFRNQAADANAPPRMSVETRSIVITPKELD
ncbi:hypothetical protein BU26DRAFT_606277 [Trematosphaeria pertusa]|uniref:Methyltransferase n=1 Tax=Trematosphaeria pertusa TaxID=390896 RepID=A0A6A6IBK5_9PLEO|nr:uncharacterized protein BU26DRAFT_606277 [Trematosphaeria pertusa]KAF2247302.1 hypothetical protein BU26DRAFT_606277 [Trematosphaeria pertusa]